MSTNTPGKLILPAVFLVGFILLTLSGFIGSVYNRDKFNPNIFASQKTPELRDTYPTTIQQWKSLIEDSGNKYQVDPNLIAAVMLQESGGNSQVISSSGAIGLMQVMPRDGIASSFICGNQPCFINRPTISELSDPEFNIAYGTRMLANLTKEEGSIRQALYRYGPFDVGYAYADAVLSIYGRFK
jgi:soluble lytic murein transglycosylase-like protein